MLVFLCVLLAVIALLAFLLSRWVRLRVAYNDADGLFAGVRFMGFTYALYPQKKPKIKLRDYKIKRFRKLEEKRRKKAAKAAEKAEKKSPAAEKAAEAVEKKAGDTGEMISEFVSLSGELLRAFAKYLHIDVSRFYVVVATGDAAKTAYCYSAAVQAAAYLTELLRNTLHFDVERDAEFSVSADFTAQSTVFEGDFTFRLRAVNFLQIGLKVLPALFKR